MYVLIFNDAKRIKVYHDLNKNKFKYISNDTAKENYFTIQVIKRKGNYFKIRATSLTTKGLQGWISNENIGIYTRPKNFSIALYIIQRSNRETHF